MTQEHSYGCGAACLAFVSGTSYEEVVKRSRKKKVDQGGYYCKELVNLSRKLGLYYRYKYLSPRVVRKIYQEGVIIYIKRSKRYPAGHYLVRYQGFWMDPWINFPSNQRIREAKSGFRQRLPGKPIYGIFPISSANYRT